VEPRFSAVRLVEFAAVDEHVGIGVAGHLERALAHKPPISAHVRPCGARLLVARAPRRSRERLHAHLWRVLVLLVAAFAVSLAVLSVGGLRANAGIALFAVGAAALGLLALIARPGGLLRRSRST
jgi:hypothetical protein